LSKSDPIIFECYGIDTISNLILHFSVMLLGKTCLCIVRLHHKLALLIELTLVHK